MTKRELKKELNLVIDQLISLETDLARTNHYGSVDNTKIMDWFNRIHAATSSINNIVKDKL